MGPMVFIEMPTANHLTRIWRMRCYTFISVFCLRKGACCLIQLCPQFRDEMGNVDLKIFFHPATLETHWRCYNWNISFQGPTNRNSFKSGVCKAVMAEWQTCFGTSTDQGLCQVLKALWEIHYFQWNWSQGSNVPSFCTHSKGVILHFPSYHK